MVYLIPRRALNSVVAHLGETRRGLHKEAGKVEKKAQANLAAARASTSHTKIDQSRAHETHIGMGEAEGKYGSIDYEVWMEGDNPMAEEFGHGPSGYFAPGRYGKVTKAPAGLYILTRAAGAGDLMLTPASGRKIGKR